MSRPGLSHSLTGVSLGQRKALGLGAFWQGTAVPRYLWFGTPSAPFHFLEMLPSFLPRNVFVLLDHVALDQGSNPSSGCSPSSVTLRDLCDHSGMVGTAVDGPALLAPR